MRAIVASLAGLLILALALPALAGPLLHMPTKEQDAGEVYAGIDVTKVFEVFNKGDAPLVIKNVKPG